MKEEGRDGCRRGKTVFREGRSTGGGRRRGRNVWMKEVGEGRRRKHKTERGVGCFLIDVMEVGCYPIDGIELK